MKLLDEELVILDADVRTAEDIKAKVSVENDVEAARTMILDLEDGQKSGSADTEEKTGAN